MILKPFLVFIWFNFNFSIDWCFRVSYQNPLTKVMASFETVILCGHKILKLSASLCSSIDIRYAVLTINKRKDWRVEKPEKPFSLFTILSTSTFLLDERTCWPSDWCKMLHFPALKSWVFYLKVLWVYDCINGRHRFLYHPRLIMLLIRPRNTSNTQNIKLLYQTTLISKIMTLQFSPAILV